MAESLQEWVLKLSEPPLPVWRDTRRSLVELAASASYGSQMLIRTAAHDPLLCAQLLRRANSGGSGERAIATLQQAAVMLGAEPMRRFATTLPVLEECLDAADQERFRQLQRRAFHVGYLARELLRRFHDSRYDEAFYAGLLHNLGELALRARAPEMLPRIRRVASTRRVGLGEAATEVLGFDIAALSGALARHWRLPGLLRSVLDTSHGQDKRSELVALAASILHEGPDALLQADSAAVTRVAEILREPAAAIGTVVFRATVEAAAHLQPRLPQRSTLVTVLYPAEPRDSHEEASPPPATAPHTEKLAGLDAVFADAAAERHPVQRVLEEFTTALHDGLGLDRVVLALVTPDHRTLRGRFFRGVAAGTALHHFEFEKDDGSLFSRLLERPAALWVQPQRRPPAALMTPLLQRTIDTGEFVAQSIFSGKRAVAVCYADRALSGKALDAETYRLFRQQCAKLSAHLLHMVADWQSGTQ